MDKIGFVFLAIILIIYGIVMTAVCIGNNSTIKKLLKKKKELENYIEYLKRKGVIPPDPGAPLQRNPSAPVAGKSASAAPSYDSHFKPTPGAAAAVPETTTAAANAATGTAAVTPSATSSAGTKQKVPVASGPVPRKKTQISSINISFAVGVMLITIVGAVFLSAAWGFMSAGVRAGVLIGVVALVFFLSWLSGHVLKLTQTGFAFYTLGSLLLPVVVCGIGILKLFGDTFSFEGGNGFLVAACAALAFSAAGLVGTGIYTNGAYHGITYFGVTWTLIFVAAQLGEGLDRFYMSYAALGLAALATRLILLAKSGKRLKFFTLYSKIIMIISSVMSVFVLWRASLPVIAGLAAVTAALILLSVYDHQSFKYLSAISALALVLSLSIFMNEELILSPIRISLIAFIILAVIYIAFIFLNTNTFVTDLIIPFVMGITSIIAGAYFMGMSGRLSSDKMIALIMILLNVGFMIVTFIRRTIPNPQIALASVELSLFIPPAIFFIYSMFMSTENGLYDLWIVSITTAVGAAAFFFRSGKERSFRQRVLVYSFLSVTAIAALIFTIIPLEDEEYLRVICYSICSWAAVALMFIEDVMRVRHTEHEDRKKSHIALATLFTLALNWLAVPVLGIISAVMKSDDELINEIVYIVVAACSLLAGGAVLWLKKGGKGKIHGLLVNISTISASVWLLLSWASEVNEYVILISAAIAVVLMYLNKNTLPAIIPILIGQAQIIRLCVDMDGGTSFAVYVAVGILMCLTGRFLHRETLVAKNNIDYLSVTPVIFIAALESGDLKSLVVCILLSLMIANLIGRVKARKEALLSVAVSLTALGFIIQNAWEYPDTLSLEIRMLIVLADILIIRYIIRPVSPDTMRKVWFIAVTLCLAIEGISAAFTGETVDLWITGLASIGIFIYSFIVKEKSWFVLAICAIIGIAIYLSATFWASLAWMFFLLLAGVILIGMAALNEYGKRHSAEGNGNIVKRFFEEWKW